nr:10353_t:CDS:2 [Entrophospora candida]
MAGASTLNNNLSTFTKQGKEKAKPVGYELNIGERICFKWYNSYIAYDRYEGKPGDATYK